MSIVKSFSVGNGDMFYIKHGSDNFSIIDCCLPDDFREDIVEEIKSEKYWKSITRFISTHPDEDHFFGLEYLDGEIQIVNFYCVKNETCKEEQTIDFKKYCELRDSEKAFYLYKGCSRKWMNLSSDENDNNDIDSSGINILWPITENSDYKEALKIAKDSGNTNNISIILKYKIEDGATMLWMGDLEKDFMEKIQDEISLPKVNILFAPHHGRKSGKIPNEWLEEMDPDIIVIGEAPSVNLDYASYDDYNTITQNTAGDILFDCDSNKVNIYVSNENYSVDFLDNEYYISGPQKNYIGTLKL